jgi:endoglucanase
MDTAALKFLRDLVATHGPTGHEAPVVAAWLKYVKPYADEVFTDAYGNGFAVLNPKGDPCVMLDGHADELGLMVTFIDDGGFLWVKSLGGYDPKVLPAMRVQVHGSGPQAKAGIALPGLVGALPPHMQRPENGDTELKVYKFGENIYVDIGAKDKKSAEKYVRVGDACVLDYGFRELRGDSVIGRGLDNKIGIWCAAEGLRRAYVARKSGAVLKAKVIAVAAVQEEIGCFGSKMAAFRIEPHAAIAVDVTQCVDHPATEKKKFGDVKLGRGPVLGHGSANHPELVMRLEKLAKRKRIQLQHEAAPRYTGTDADEIYITRAGVPTGVVSLPQRYMHSPSEMVNLKDLNSIAELLAAFCLDLKAGERFMVKV